MPKLQNSGLYQEVFPLLMEGTLDIEACTYSLEGNIVNILHGDVPVLWIDRDTWDLCKAGRQTLWIFEPRIDITQRLMALQEYGGPHEVHHD